VPVVQARLERYDRGVSRRGRELREVELPKGRGRERQIDLIPALPREAFHRGGQLELREGDGVFAFLVPVQVVERESMAVLVPILFPNQEGDLGSRESEMPS